jgi:signal transduction histidine kinase
MFSALLMALIMAGAAVAQARDMFVGIPQAPWAVVAVVVIGGLFMIFAASRAERSARDAREAAMRLESANLRLGKLDTLKSEFLSFASHQVKAPMTVVKGYATLIVDGSYGDVSGQVRDIAAKIKDSADRMIALVNSFLDLRRLEEGRIQYVWADVDLGSLVNTVVEDMRQLAGRKKLALVYEQPAQTWTVNADAQVFRQVLQNLIDNAIKYTEQGTVTVSVGAGANGTVRIQVSDTGRGISAELLPKLFSQFTRDQSIAREVAGTGLGLYIAQQIVQAHRGTLWANSKGIGTGSTFSLQLPVVRGRQG